jgi:hypothetical protein
MAESESIALALPKPSKPTYNLQKKRLDRKAGDRSFFTMLLKVLFRHRVLPDRQHYYEHPSSYGQPESADRLP